MASMLPRIAIAAVWIYQGLWCKVLGHAPHHQKIVETTTFLNCSRARRFLIALGVFECVLAIWAFSGIWAREGAIVQTALIVAMNTAALLRARQLIADPVSMLLQNCVFVTLAWIAAGQFNCYAGAA